MSNPVQRFLGLFAGAIASSLRRLAVLILLAAGALAGGLYWLFG